MTRTKNNHKYFQLGNVRVKPAKFDLEAVLKKLLNEGQYQYDRLNSFYFTDLLEIARQLGLERGDANIKSTLRSYLTQNAIVLVGKSKNSQVYINPDWLWYGVKYAEDELKSKRYHDARSEYRLISFGIENDSKYTAKKETKELLDRLELAEHSIASNDVVIDSLKDDIRRLHTSQELLRKAVVELFRTDSKPPADVTIEGKDYHVTAQLEVQVRHPELAAHHTLKDVDDSMGWSI
jgi:hypothetical protein